MSVLFHCLARVVAPGRRRLAGGARTLNALPCVAAMILGPGPAHAQAAFDAAASTRQVDVRTRFGYEIMHMPDHSHVGLVGMTQLFSVGGEWWFGPGLYGAVTGHVDESFIGPGVYGGVTGHYGGLFVSGAEVAWSHPFRDRIGVDAGLFAGGGGGANAPAGGGLMLRPHVDLVFEPIDGFYTGPTWSLVQFLNGDIHSQQVGWMINVTSQFRVRPVDRIVPDAPTDGSASGLGVDRIVTTVTDMHPRDTRHLSDFAPLEQAIGLVGMRVEHSIGGGPFYMGLEAAGAVEGGVAGYSEVLGTGGLHWPVVGERLTFDIRASFGAGGGGDVYTGGGRLVKGALGATLRITDTLGVGLEAGLSHAPGGHFDARQASVAIDWLLDPPRPSPAEAWTAVGHAEATRLEFASGAEHEDAARKDDRTAPLDAVVLQVNRFVTPNVYVSARIHSACAGGAGAYRGGLAGLGTQWPLGHGWRLGAEALGGTAGGGGVDTGSGAVLQARAYLDLALGEQVSLRAGAGRIQAVHGGLDSSVVDAALVFRFAVDRSR